MARVNTVRKGKPDLPNPAIFQPWPDFIPFRCVLTNREGICLSDKFEDVHHNEIIIPHGPFLLAMSESFYKNTPHRDPFTILVNAGHALSYGEVANLVVKFFIHCICCEENMKAKEAWDQTYVKWDNLATQGWEASRRVIGLNQVKNSRYIKYEVVMI